MFRRRDEPVRPEPVARSDEPGRKKYGRGHLVRPEQGIGVLVDVPPSVIEGDRTHRPVPRDVFPAPLLQEIERFRQRHDKEMALHEPKVVFEGFHIDIHPVLAQGARHDPVDDPMVHQDEHSACCHLLQSPLREPEGVKHGGQGAFSEKRRLHR